MVQIDTPRGVQNATEICEVSGLSAIFVGLGDLSQCLGISGELQHRDLHDSARKVLKAAKHAGKMSAMIVDTAEDAIRWAAEGTKIFCCGVDIPTIAKSLHRIRAEFTSLQ
jgi:4-hydroxy-2-oxoheptanedioate aldolase